MKVSGILLFALLVLIALASMLDVTEAGSSVSNKASSGGNRNVVVNDDDDDDDGNSLYKYSRYNISSIESVYWLKRWRRRRQWRWRW